MTDPVIAIVPDGFKGCMSSFEAARAIESGLRQGLPKVTTRIIPMADGGEGTVDAMVTAMSGTRHTVRVCGPLGQSVEAMIGLVDHGHTALLEMASASGIALLAPGERDCMGAHTLGTGELIRAALDRGVKKIILGLGGSASTDGGTGMARALGVRFLDHQGNELPLGGGGLTRLHEIDVRHLDPRIKEVAIIAACDVTTPLCGPMGAASIFGPQKGATPAMVAALDQGLDQLSRLMAQRLGRAVAHLPGAGAAGGLGGGLVAFLGARLQPGAAMVAETIRLRQRLAGVDLVITGEGRLDGQTLAGKAPAQVARVAKSLGLPVIAICGIAGPGVEHIHQAGIDAWFVGSSTPLAPEDIPRLGPAMITTCARRIGLLLNALPSVFKNETR
ncbi:MAG: glycerate kinase [Magnetococcales bacterium]|nr:glycerate kinase [Magnetococcales bacterium]